MNWRVFAVAVLTLGIMVAQPPAAVSQVMEKKVLTLAVARKMVAAAEAEAERNGWAGAIAVVDDGGWPILIVRMDNAALLAGIVLAPGKARTAALFRRPSQALEDAINNGRTALLTAGDFVEMKGALPIEVEGQVIGAIGVSADTPDHDVLIAQAGLAAFEQ